MLPITFIRFSLLMLYYSLSLLELYNPILLDTIRAFNQESFTS